MEYEKDRLAFLQMVSVSREMMSPPLAANDGSPHTLRNEVAALRAAMMRCLPLTCRRHTSSAKRHHVRSTHPLPDRANIIEKTSSFDEVFSGGGRWIRTTEGIASRFTVCPLWPLGNSPRFTYRSKPDAGAGRRTRTPDLLITNQLLYQLSYTSTQPACI